MADPSTIHYRYIVAVPPEQHAALAQSFAALVAAGAEVSLHGVSLPPPQCEPEADDVPSGGAECGASGPPSPPATSLTCEFCNRPFTGQQGLTLHRRACPQNPGNADDDAGALFVCRWCGREFKKSQGLARHRGACKQRPADEPAAGTEPAAQEAPEYTKVGGDYTCAICQRLFTKRADLERHRKAAHRGPRPMPVSTLAGPPPGGNDDEDGD